MKAITLWQPWATLVANGIKRYETRTWRPLHTGPLAIHAAGRHSFHPQYMKAANMDILMPDLKMANLPFGAVVAVVDLVSCVEMTEQMIEEQSKYEKLVGYWIVGRWAWKFDNVRPLRTPITYLGHQGIWNLPDDVVKL